MPDDPAVQAPELPPLTETSLAALTGEGRLDATAAAIDGTDEPPAELRRLRLRECRLVRVSLAPGPVPGIDLLDVVIDDCRLSNLDGREGSLRRVAITGSQLVGLGLRGGQVRDVRISDCSLELASFAGAQLRDVVFERVKLADASFLDARLEAVSFVDCVLAGADFRGARLRACAIRGASLDGVLGVDALRGLRMPWPDLLDSVGALATALGIEIEA